MELNNWNKSWKGKFITTKLVNNDGFKRYKMMVLKPSS